MSESGTRHETTAKRYHRSPMIRAVGARAAGAAGTELVLPRQKPLIEQRFLEHCQKQGVELRRIAPEQRHDFAELARGFLRNDAINYAQRHASRFGLPYREPPLFEPARVTTKLEVWYSLKESDDGWEHSGLISDTRDAAGIMVNAHRGEYLELKGIDMLIDGMMNNGYTSAMSELRDLRVAYGLVLGKYDGSR